MLSIIPIQYKEIDQLLAELILQLQIILKEKLVGLYIGGSLATDSFQDETSDIDCYIITTHSFSEDQICEIKKMHQQFYSSNRPYTKKIEASYIPQQDLLNFEPNGKRPYFNEGCFYWGQYGHNYLIELHVLREKGIPLMGPDIKTLVKTISTQNLMLAIQKNLYEYWTVTVDDDKKFSRSDYQVFAILTMCRTLYSLETGHIASKKDAAQWAMQNLDIKWQNLIEQALVWKPGQVMNQAKEAQRFVNYALTQHKLIDE